MRPEGIEGYSLAIADIPFKALNAAMNRAIQECRFFPSAAELRELAGMSVPKPKQLAEGAWGSVIACLTTKRWADLDPQTARALKAIGSSSTVRNTDDHGMSFLRTRFLDVYPHCAEELPAIAPVAESFASPDHERNAAKAREVIAGLSKKLGHTPDAGGTL